MRSRRSSRHFVVALTLVATACTGDGPTRPGGVAEVETAAVLNSIDLSLTVFPVDAPQSARSIGLAQAGSPVSLAVRGNRAAVPLGLLSSLAIVDLAAGEVDTVIPLPDGSGATGVAFFNDSIAYVANPNLNSVSRVNVLSGVVGPDSIPVSIFPQAVVASSDRIFVMNGELDASFRPARQGVISVIDPTTNSVSSTILLSGSNPSAASFGRDGRLYVVNSGTFGWEDGSLSVVDPGTLSEVEHHPGFGEFPGGIAFGPDGLAYVSAFAYGVAVWDPIAVSFVRPPSDPLIARGHTTSSGVGFDSNGRLYSLIPGDCIGPSVAVRLGPPPDLGFDREIDVGVCPIGIAFTTVQSP